MKEIPIVIEISADSNVSIEAAEDFGPGDFTDLQIAVLESGAEIAGFEITGRKIALEFASEDEGNVGKVSGAVATFATDYLNKNSTKKKGATDD